MSGDISWEELALALRRRPREIKFAAVRALNDTAFKALKAIPARIASDVNMTTDARRAGGFRVARATMSNNEADLLSDRTWLRYHIDAGQRGVRSGGFVHKGREYLLSVVEKAAFAPKGKRLHAGYARGMFVVMRGTYGLVMYRAKKGDKNATLIAIIKPRFKYNEDIGTRDEVIDQWNAHAQRLFRIYLTNPLARGVQ